MGNIIGIETTSSGGNIVNFDFFINDDGISVTSSSFSNTNFIGYKSYATPSKKNCIPSDQTLKNAFKDYKSSFASIQPG